VDGGHQFTTLTVDICVQHSVREALVALVCQQITGNTIVHGLYGSLGTKRRN